MKTKKGFIALMIWAIDRDCMNISVLEAMQKFKKDALAMYETYTTPGELFCKNIIGQNPVNVFIDYVLFYAKMHVVSGIKDYGKYNKDIVSF